MLALSYNEIKNEYKNICFLSFDPMLQKAVELLLIFFSAAGFNAFLAADFDGLIGRYFDIRMSYGDPTDSRDELREELLQHEALINERGVPIDKIDAGSTLFVLLRNGRLPFISEEAQISLWKLGLEKNIAFFDTKTKRFYKCSGPVLSKLEYHAARHCNLKCKGCSHYSNLIDEPEFGDVNAFSKNLERIGELFDDILLITLTGGEPLLNKNILELVREARSKFPNAAVQVFTNGLLIPTLDEKTLDAFRRYGVVLNITNYPPTDKIKDRIEKILFKHGVMHMFNRTVRTLNYCVGETEHDAEMNFRYCSHRMCNQIYNDGRFSVCGLPLYYDDLKHKLEAKRELSDKDWIDIYKERNGYETLKKLHTPLPFCRYCNYASKVYFEWEAPYEKELREDDPCLIRLK